MKITYVKLNTADVAETLTGKTVRHYFRSGKQLEQTMTVEKIITGFTKINTIGRDLETGTMRHAMQPAVKVTLRPVDGGRAITRTMYAADALAIVDL